MNSVNSMFSLSVDLLENHLPPDIIEDLDIAPAWMTPAGLTWWSSLARRVENHPRLQHPWINPEALAFNPNPETSRVDILFASRSGFAAMTDIENALGCHLLSTPDFDPFRDISPVARKHRILVVSDREEFIRHIKDLADGDLNPDLYIREYLESWILTFFHEIAHVVLFAENAAFLSPAEVEVRSDSGEFPHDIFDCSTGYGIRPFVIDGEETWADELDDALILMEHHVESFGRDLMLHALQPPSPFSALDFPAVMNIEDDIRQILGTS